MTGAGDPVTVFAHGLAGGIPDTRPLGSGVAGQKVFPHFRGHGRSRAPAGEWTYADLADDLRAVADRTGATRALGVSLGAGALCRLVAGTPDRFDRLVFFLPAVVDVPRQAAARERLGALFAATAARDPARVAREVLRDVPESLRHTAAARAFAAQRVAALLTDGLGPSLAALPAAVAVPDAAALGAVRAPALVIACRGDDLHPVTAAERLASLLGDATLHVYDQPAVLWTARADLRARIAGFLNG